MFSNLQSWRPRVVSIFTIFSSIYYNIYSHLRASFILSICLVDLRVGSLSALLFPILCVIVSSQLLCDCFCWYVSVLDLFPKYFAARAPRLCPPGARNDSPHWPQRFYPALSIDAWCLVAKLFPVSILNASCLLYDYSFVTANLMVPSWLYLLISLLLPLFLFFRNLMESDPIGWGLTSNHFYKYFEIQRHFPKLSFTDTIPQRWTLEEDFTLSFTIPYRRQMQSPGMLSYRLDTFSNACKCRLQSFHKYRNIL